MKGKIIFEPAFSDKCFTAAKECGNMKEAAARASFFHCAGLDPDKLVLANQVHGNTVKTVDASAAGTIIGDCDALITREKDLILGIFTADCMPVFIVCEKSGAKAAIHAGWRGLASGIIENAVSAMVKEFKVLPEKLKAYIGPHIRECCYEVKKETADIFKAKLINDRLCLSEIAVRKLQKNGLQNIFASEHCTFCRKDLFFSYRRDKTEERQINLIF
ncbi:MAG: peptidoglycan editing factor PgeF [Endomicrobium sp.]|jgi:YfiH family protein|nr:peptidoglycan editing factor PgeF [Endomicrobium sp.]